MDVVSSADLFGAWVSIFLTLCVFSFLYDDNPIYKLAEHIFLGVSIGYGVVEVWFGVLKPNLWEKLSGESAHGFQRVLWIVPLILVLLLFSKVVRNYAWLARIPIAFIVAAYAGVKLTGEANANLMTQVAQTIPDLSASWTENGLWNWSNDGAGVLSDVILLVGLTACLVHFYFSDVPAKTQAIGGKLVLPVFIGVIIVSFALLGGDGGLSMGPRILIAVLLGATAAVLPMSFSPKRPWVTRFGVLMLMLSFGASFGYTVMGRISLAIGRVQEMLGLDKPPEAVAEIRPTVATLVCLVFVVGFLVVWRMRGGGEPTDGGPTASAA